MATTILSPEKDPMGAAISDYFNRHKADCLRVPQYAIHACSGTYRTADG